MHIKNTSKFLMLTIFLVNFLALVFQVIWVREIMTTFGSSALSVSIVLSVFLGGIALGAYLGGKLVDGLADKYKYTGYSLMLLGFYCLFLPLVFNIIEYPFSFIRSFVETPFLLNLFKFVICSFVLIVPTTIIGAMFPVITYLYSKNSDHIGKDVASVYFFDTVGATFGAILCGFVFVPYVGLLETTIASSIVFILLGYTMTKVATPVGSKNAKKQEKEETSKKLDREHVYILVLLFLSGFTAILLEVVWVRFFQLLLGSSNYAFSLVVAAFLFGLAVGSFIIRRFMAKIKNYGKVFAFIAVSIAVSSLLVPLSFDPMRVFYFFVFKSVSNFYLFQCVLFFVAFLIMCIPTILMGANFPLAVQLFSRVDSSRGHDAGLVFSSNTAGGIFGSFAAGFLIIPSIGLWHSSVFASLIYIFIALVFLVIYVENPFVYVTAISVLTAFLLPILFLTNYQLGKDQGVYIAAPRYKNYSEYKKVADQMKTIFSKQGFYGLVTVGKKKYSNTIYLRNNGKTDASTGEGDAFNQVMLGHKAFFFHKNPKKVLNIGLGGGFTLGAINTHPMITEVDAIEIDPLVVDVVEKYFAPYNGNALADKRVNMFVEDGRHFLDTTNNKYDIIVSEPPNIWVSGVSRLFTREFYSSASDHLNKGGILVQWVPGYELRDEDFTIIVNTIRERFQYVKYWYNPEHNDIIIMASHDSYKVDREFVKQILSEKLVVNNIMKEAQRLTYDKLVDYVVGYNEISPSLEYLKKIKKVNTDNLPYLEFSTAKNLYSLER